MFEFICMMKRSTRRCNERANETSGLQGGVKITAMPYKKDNTLCSPTSALEKKLMLSHLGEELMKDSSGATSFL